MADSREDKPTKGPSENMRESTTQSPGALVTSQSRQGENTKKPSTRTRAADRILARLEKTKTEKTEKKPEVKPEEPTENAPKAPHPEKEIEFRLTGESAQAAEALRQEMVSEDALIAAFLTQLKSENRDERRTLLAILKEDHKLSAKHCATLQKIEKAIVTHKKTTPRKLDFVLGQQLLEQNLLAREELQQILRIQIDLRKLGVNRALDQLLTASKMVSPDLLKPLVAQFTSPDGMAVKGRGAAIKTGNRQTYPVFTWTLTITLLFLGSFFALLYFLMLGEDRIREAKLKEPVKSKVVREKKIVEINLPFDLYAEDEKKYGKKHADKKRLAAGLVKWGKYWIGQEQKKKLLTQKLVPGKPMRDAQLSFSRPPKITVRQRGKKCTVTIKGVLKSHDKSLPILPTGFRLQMEAQLFHPFRQHSIQEGKLFFLDDHSRINITLGPFSKKLPANLYYVRLSLAASRQKKYLNYLFAIKGNHEWWFSFFSENNPRIAKMCGNYKQLVEKRIKTLHGYYREMREAAERYEEFKQEKRPKRRFREYWVKQAPQWKRGLNKMQRQLNDRRKSELMPLYPKAESGLPKLLMMLIDIYAKWDGWQRDRSYELPDLEREYIQFELKYEEILMSLHSEEKKLLSIIERESQKIDQPKKDGN